MSHDSNHNMGIGPFVFEQTYLANILGCLTLWFIWLFYKVITSTVCKCLILTNMQEDDQAANDLSPSW